MQSVRCVYCDNVFEVSDDETRTQLPCPGCNTMVSLGAQLPGTDKSPRLRLRAEPGAANRSNPCPRCSSPVLENSSLCVHCGYNLETGKIHSDIISARRKRRTWKFAVTAGLLVLLVAALQLGRSFRRRRADVTAPEREAVYDEVAGEAVSGQPGVDPSARALRLRELREVVETELAQNYPPLEEGRQATIYARGIGYSGIYRGVTNGQVKIETDLSVRRLDLEQLDRDSRLRCDPEFRAEHRERLVERRMERE